MDKLIFLLATFYTTTEKFSSVKDRFNDTPFQSLPLAGCFRYSHSHPDDLPSLLTTEKEKGDLSSLDVHAKTHVAS
jgi:hypothetical protein